MTTPLAPQEAVLIVSLLERHARKLKRARDNRIARGVTFVPDKGKRDADLLKIDLTLALAAKVRGLTSPALPATDDPAA